MLPSFHYSRSTFTTRSAQAQRHSAHALGVEFGTGSEAIVGRAGVPLSLVVKPKIEI